MKTATISQFNDIQQFYYHLIDTIPVSYDIGWKKDIYPSKELLKESIAKNELWIAYENEKIVSCMICNHEYNESYQKVNWIHRFNNDEIMVIHALGVDPDYKEKGYAKRMVKKAIDLANKEKMKAIRLDVLKGNLPAEKLYVKMGFQYISTVTMYYEDTGWTEYKLYEYDIEMNEEEKSR